MADFESLKQLDLRSRLDLIIASFKDAPDVKVAIEKIKQEGGNPISFLVSNAFITNSINLLKNYELPPMMFAVVRKVIIEENINKILDANRISIQELEESIQKLQKLMKSQKKKIDKMEEYYHTTIDINMQILSNKHINLESKRLKQDETITIINEKVESNDNLIKQNDIEINERIKELRGEIELFREYISKSNTTGLELRICELEEFKSSKPSKSNQSNQKVMNKLSIIDTKLKKIEDNTQIKELQEDLNIERTEKEQLKEEIKQLKIILQNQNDTQNNKFQKFKKILDDMNMNFVKQQSEYNTQIKELQNKLDKSKNIKDKDKDKDINEELQKLKNMLDSMNNNFVKQQSENNRVNEDKIVKIVQYNIHKIFEEQQKSLVYQQQYEQYQQEYPVVSVNMQEVQ